MPAVNDRVPLIGSERRLQRGQTLIGAADAHERLTVTVQVRRRPGAPALPDPQEFGQQRPSRRAQVDRKAITAALIADPGDLAQVKAFAKHHGLKLVEEAPERRTVQLSGTVAQFNTAFGVQLKQYREGEHTFRARQGSVMIPRHLHGIIERVSGLTNRPLARPHHKLMPKVAEGMSAQQVGRLYDFPQDVDCTGQNIALIQLGGGYSQQDLDTYFEAFGIRPPQVVSVGVDGSGNNYGAPGGADAEVELDIEIAGTNAPGATIVVYFAPNTEQGFIDAVYAAVNSTQYPPTVISISWGAPEDAGWTAAGLAGMDSAFYAAALKGVTVLAAAGDNGSNDNVYDGRAHCDFPASDPYVLACGGTSLQLDGKGALQNEVTWNNNNGWATGGGVSDVYPLPAWQPADSIPHQVDTGQEGRGVPDIAGNADPIQSPYQVVVDGNWMAIGGTSAVSPLYAGLLASIAASSNCMPGFISPYLYQLMSQSNLYFDIDAGNNTVSPAPGYAAIKGWDACTGIGRIVGSQLLAVI